MWWYRRQVEEQRLFMRDLMRRMDIITERHGKAMDRLERRMDERLRAVERTVDDHRDESRALLQAVLALTDEIRGGGLHGPSSA
jgi:hypothetical protein